MEEVVSGVYPVEEARDLHYNTGENNYIGDPSIAQASDWCKHNN